MQPAPVYCEIYMCATLNYWTGTISSVASLTIKSRYANISVFIDCENNQFLKK